MLEITYDYHYILSTNEPVSTPSKCTKQTQNAIPPLLAGSQSAGSSSPSIRIELVLCFHPLQVRDIHSLEDDLWLMQECLDEYLQPSHIL